MADTSKTTKDFRFTVTYSNDDTRLIKLPDPSSDVSPANSADVKSKAGAFAGITLTDRTGETGTYVSISNGLVVTQTTTTLDLTEDD